MVARDRDLAVKEVADLKKEAATLKMSKDVVTKSNAELYEKLTRLKNNNNNSKELENAIQTLQTGKEKYLALEQTFKALEEKHASQMKENTEDMKKLIARVGHSNYLRI